MRTCQSYLIPVIAEPAVNSCYVRCSVFLVYCTTWTRPTTNGQDVRSVLTLSTRGSSRALNGTMDPSMQMTTLRHLQRCHLHLHPLSSLRLAQPLALDRPCTCGLCNDRKSPLSPCHALTPGPRTLSLRIRRLFTFFLMYTTTPSSCSLHQLILSLTSQETWTN
jgi:hypothetical protein